MYLHVGLQMLLEGKDIVAIINLEDKNLTAINKEFLEIALYEKKIRGCDQNLAKSCIITAKEIYFSNISSNNRLHFIHCLTTIETPLNIYFLF